MTGETPMVGRFYCPGCEPGADPLTEVVTVSWCQDHAPVLGGSEDGQVVIGGMGMPLGASFDADGTDCRLAAEALRRGRR